MKTVNDNQNLSAAEQLESTKLAKGGTWYDDDWRPYCAQTQTTCHSRLIRMQKMPYGFKCNYCGNMIGFDLTRLKESPLNYIV